MTEYAVFTATHPDDVYETTSMHNAHKHAEELVEAGHSPTIERYTDRSTKVYSWAQFNAFFTGDI
jgi:predicted transcriptional regulator YdeE